jgi:siroheme synthase (precorrin-2 oxidase/ferrochelatase)
LFQFGKKGQDYLPLFAELKQRPVLVIGGGEIAERKIKFLLRAQATLLQSAILRL